MNFSIDLNVKFAPEVQNFLAFLFNQKQTPVQNYESRQQLDAPKSVTSIVDDQPVAEPKKEKVKALTLVDVRAAMAECKAPREAKREILTSFDVTSVAHLKEEDFESFLTKLKAL